ncbi:hypothetical protein D3C78_1838700 [compost metagenome]
MRLPGVDQHRRAITERNPPTVNVEVSVLAGHFDQHMAFGMGMGNQRMIHIQQGDPAKPAVENPLGNRHQIPPLA